MVGWLVIGGLMVSSVLVIVGMVGNAVDGYKSARTEYESGIPLRKLAYDEEARMRLYRDLVKKLGGQVVRTPPQFAPALVGVVSKSPEAVVDELPRHMRGSGWDIKARVAEERPDAAFVGVVLNATGEHAFAVIDDRAARRTIVIFHL